MPVILEQITTPAPQDSADLRKIYSDYSAVANSGEADDCNWIEQQLSQRHTLLAGRFNGRLVAAIWGEQTQQGLQLDHLCVRDLTRGRGVARQLLTLITQQADKNNTTLLVQRHRLPAELQQLFISCGFNDDSSSSGWIREPGTP